MAGRTTHPFEDYIIERDPVKVATKHKELREFERDLDVELGKAFAYNSRPYDKVHVLLICWRTADSNNLEDLEVMKRFLEKEFNFMVKIFQIDGDAFKPDKKALLRELHNLFDIADSSTLTIIGYSGHGYPNSTQTSRSQRKDLVIFPRHDIVDRPNFHPDTTHFGIPYSTIYAGLLEIEGDVLHLLECCSGGGAALDRPHEILAASASYQPGKQTPSSSHSGGYMHAIIESMKELKQTHGAFTTVQLHSHAVSKALDSKPELYIQPFYSGTFEGKKRPITLTPLSPANFPNPRPQPKMLLKEAKVLLSIAITPGKEKMEDLVTDMLSWLTSPERPVWVKSIEIAGIMPTNGSLILLTLPISLWHVLPEHPAYKKIDFVAGGNILLEYN